MNSVVLFFLCGQKDLMQMRFTEMRPVYGDKCFTRPAIHVWCTKLLAAEKALLIRNERPGRHVATTDATIAAVDAFVRWDKCLKNLDDMLKNETFKFNL